MKAHPCKNRKDGAPGNIQNESDYYPYGGEIVVSSGDSNRYKFTGQERDTESGLDHLGARQYNSAIGRFMVPDPARALAQNPNNPQSWNLYAYVLNNPLRAFDPSGLDCVYVNPPVVADASTNNGPPNMVLYPSGDGNTYGVMTGDCASNNDDGFYFDGTVNGNSVGLNANGDVVGSVDSGSGLSTQCSGECPDLGPKLPPDVSVNANLDVLDPQAVELIGRVAALTFQFNKQMNCGAAFVYQLLPGPKPEDFGFGDAAEDVTRTASEKAEDAASKFERFKRNGNGVIRNRQARVSAAKLARRVKALNVAEKVISYGGYALGAIEGAKQFNDCENGKTQ